MVIYTDGQDEFHGAKKRQDRIAGLQSVKTFDIMAIMQQWPEKAPLAINVKHNSFLKEYLLLL